MAGKHLFDLRTSRISDTKEIEAVLDTVLAVAGSALAALTPERASARFFDAVEALA
ncbi:MAG: hypothetical protein JWR80_8072 [Bradyrhizobium sp.]|nr:hypothetical protein [Bradyrhizobium sp.]